MSVAQMTANAREMFKKYGFIPSNSFKYRGHYYSYRVFDEVHNKFVRYSLKDFQDDIKSGRVQEIDPFLHVLQSPGSSGHSLRSSDKLERFTRNFPMDKFRHESEQVRRATMEKVQEFRADIAPKRINNLGDVEAVKIKSSGSDDQDKVSLYAMISIIYSVSEQYYPNHKVGLVVEYKPNKYRDYLFPSYHHLDDETIALMQNLINSLWYGAELTISDDSDKYMLNTWNAWESMSIYFEEDRQNVKNKLDKPVLAKGQRRAGAKWGWINTTSIDLSKYGIFNTFDPQNYRYPCLVHAFQHSNILSNSELEYIKSVMNTRNFPIDNIKFICEKLGISVAIYYYDSNENKVHSPTIYGNTESRKIDLLLRDGHYMLWDREIPISPVYIEKYKYFDENINPKSFEKRFQARKLNNMGFPTLDKKTMSINEIINLFFKYGYFRPLTPREKYQTLMQQRDISFIDLEYPPCCTRAIVHQPPVDTQKIVKYTSDINSIVAKNPGIQLTKYKGTTRIAESDDVIYKNNVIFFSFDNPTNDEISLFRDVMLEKFGLNIDSFNSAAAIGQELMHRYGCYNNVYQLSGKPAIFISNCSPKITVSPAFGEVQDISGDLCSIDKNGSYTSVYRDFEGIPCGKPKILQTFTDVNAYDMYYVYVDITSMKCRHKEERFGPGLRPGPQGTEFPFGPGTKSGPTFLSKTMLLNLLVHYDLQYEFISGYYFDEGFNDNIKKLSRDLYELREYYKSIGSRIEAAFKGILCTLWGKCTYKPKKFVQKTKDVTEFDKVKNKHGVFLYSSQQVNDKTISYSLVKPLSLEYGLPQFSTNILSFSRAFMNDLYFKAADLDIPIYYSNTDCLLMNRADIDKLGVVGDKLGEFKIEYADISRAIIISAKKFLWIYKDGTIRCVYRKQKPTVEENIAFFENLSRKLLA